MLDCQRIIKWTNAWLIKTWMSISCLGLQYDALFEAQIIWYTVVLKLLILFEVACKKMDPLNWSVWRCVTFPKYHTLVQRPTIHWTLSSFYDLRKLWSSPIIKKYTASLVRTWSAVSLHDTVQTDTTTDRTTYFPSLSSPDLLWSLGLARQTRTIASIQYSINFPVFYLGELVQTGTAYIYIRSAVIWGKISWYDEKTLIKLLTLLKLIRICY